MTTNQNAIDLFAQWITDRGIPMGPDDPSIDIIAGFIEHAKIGNLPDAALAAACAYLIGTVDTELEAPLKVIRDYFHIDKGMRWGKIRSELLPKFHDYMWPRSCALLKGGRRRKLLTSTAIDRVKKMWGDANPDKLIVADKYGAAPILRRHCEYKLKKRTAAKRCDGYQLLEE